MSFHRAVVLGAVGAVLIYASSPRVEALDDFNLASYGANSYIKTTRTEVILKVVPYTSDKVLNREFKKLNGQPMPEGSGIRGFTVVKPNSDVCYVHIIPARLWDDREAMAILGHEIYHCLMADHE